MARKKIFNINQRYLLIFSGPVHPDISAHSAVCTDFITVIFNQIVYDVYTVLGGGENGGEGGEMAAAVVATTFRSIRSPAARARSRATMITDRPDEINGQNFN